MSFPFIFSFIIISFAISNNDSITICPRSNIRWKTSDWNQCDTRCGKGYQIRNIACIHENGTKLSLNYCDIKTKPTTRRICMNEPCSPAGWIRNIWSNCTSGCGLLIATRTVYCSTKSGEILPEKFCTSSRKPVEYKACQKKSNCRGIWFKSDYGPCSVTCGRGLKTRSVFCGQMIKGRAIQINEFDCDQTKKPKDRISCREKPCEADWFVSDWEMCSSPAGGQQKRKIFCLNGDGLPFNRCQRSKRPKDIGSCSGQSNAAMKRRCLETDHGCCPDGKVPRKADFSNCLPIQVFDCSTTEFGCCDDGKTTAFGPFKDGCNRIFERKALHSREDVQRNAATNEKVYQWTIKDDRNDLMFSDEVILPMEHTESTLMINCRSSEFGCCQDNKTVAFGYRYLGCPCNTYFHGCCQDGMTPARGPNYDGCLCERMYYGCCPDGITPATGKKQQGCFINDANLYLKRSQIYEEEKDKRRKEISLEYRTECTLEMNKGDYYSCFAGASNRYYFDIKVQACKQFLYKGCGGNGNNFKTRRTCEDRCKKKVMKSNSIPNLKPTEKFEKLVPPYEFIANKKFLRRELVMDPIKEAVKSYINKDQLFPRAPRIVLKKICPSNPACNVSQCRDGAVNMSFDRNGCPQCECRHGKDAGLCKKTSCPSKSRCVIEKLPDGKAYAICEKILKELSKRITTKKPIIKKKSIKKPGECPKNYRYGRNAEKRCRRECEEDSECNGNKKCCVHECDFICQDPDFHTERWISIEELAKKGKSCANRSNRRFCERVKELGRCSESSYSNYCCKTCGGKFSFH